MSYTNEQLDEFIELNYNACVGICQAWCLEITGIEDLRQAAEYLIDQI